MESCFTCRWRCECKVATTRSQIRLPRRNGAKYWISPEYLQNISTSPDPGKFVIIASLVYIHNPIVSVLSIACEGPRRRFTREQRCGFDARTQETKNNSVRSDRFAYGSSIHLWGMGYLRGHQVMIQESIWRRFARKQDECLRGN